MGGPERAPQAPRTSPPRMFAPRTFLVGRGGMLVDRDAPVDSIFFGRVVAGGLVVRAPVVPDDDVALAPSVTVLALGLDHVPGQLLDQRVALPLLEPLAPQALTGIAV